MTYLISLLVLLVLDVLTTLYSLAKVKGGHEANPVMLWIMDRIGVAQTLWITHIVVGGIGFWIYTAGMMWPIGAMLVAAYAFVVLSNTILILTGRSLIQRIVGR